MRAQEVLKSADVPQVALHVLDPHGHRWSRPLRCLQLRLEVRWVLRLLTFRLLLSVARYRWAPVPKGLEYGRVI